MVVPELRLSPGARLAVMTMTMEPWPTEPPGPDGARSIAELGGRLRALRAWAGLSVREVHRRVVRHRRSRGIVELPALDTVHRCFRPDRMRLDQELVTDVARALLGDDQRAAEWRHAHRVVTGRTGGGAAVAVRSGLPEPPHRFVGRRAELAALLRAGDLPAGDRPAVAVLHGMAGVGKTSLARYAARLLNARGRFADLLLAVNLRGSDLEHPPADPGVVLDLLLRELGCSAYEIYDLDLPGRTDQLRRTLAGRRTLILLDDAATSDQVAPLLPSDPACLTLVTSRRQLTALPAAWHVGVAPFAPGESHELLAGVLGTARLADEPAAAAGIADLVGHLPLALALVAGRIRGTPHWTLADHLARLVERRAHLSLDRVVALAVEASYASLPAPRKQLLRLLATHPGRSIDGYAAAALAGAELSVVAGDLVALADESLLVRRADGWFELHDLVRVFAADRASDVDPPGIRVAALTRLFDYYRHVTYQAARLHEPHFIRTAAPPRPDTAVPALPDRAGATAWLETERPNLIACAEHCASHELPGYTSDLAALLHHFLYTAGHLPDMERLERRASQVTRGIDQARAWARLGSICSWLGRLDEAREHYRRALAVLTADGDRGLRARCLANYGVVHRRLGRLDRAIRCHQRARALFLAGGEESLAAQQLGQLGRLYLLTGRHADGVRSLQDALAVCQQTADRIGEAGVRGNLGTAALVAGRWPEALDHYRQALRIFTELGDRAGEGVADNACGTALTASGEPGRALERHQRALATARDIGDREGEAEALIEGGHALHRLARFDDALAWHGDALRLAEKTGNAWQQARAHDGTASARVELGDPELARRHWQQSFALHTAMRTVDAGRVVVRLAEVGGGCPTVPVAPGR